MNTATEDYLTREEEQILLRIGRDTLVSWVHRGEVPALEQYPLTPALREKHAAFVTLRERGQLRGCVGYTANIEPLAKTVQENTINAATRDTRFPPVDSSELDDIVIEISALTPGDAPETPFKEIHDHNEIVIGRDGLYISKPGTRGGLLLPQVPVEQRWGVPEFLAAVCRKAGYPDYAWQEPGVKLCRFSAQVFSESGGPNSIS
jgi:AmmeMemoRadiSam system protein A